MLELFVSSLITFFVVIDPPGCAKTSRIAAATPTARIAIARRWTGVAPEVSPA